VLACSYWAWTTGWMTRLRPLQPVDMALRAAGLWLRNSQPRIGDTRDMSRDILDFFAGYGLGSILYQAWQIIRLFMRPRHTRERRMWP
jgi:hypothetical protein